MPGTSEGALAGWITRKMGAGRDLTNTTPHERLAAAQSVLNDARAAKAEAARIVGAKQGAVAAGNAVQAAAALSAAAREATLNVHPRSNASPAVLATEQRDAARVNSQAAVANRTAAGLLRGEDNADERQRLTAQARDHDRMVDAHDANASDHDRVVAQERERNTPLSSAAQETEAISGRANRSSETLRGGMASGQTAARGHEEAARLHGVAAERDRTSVQHATGPRAQMLRERSVEHTTAQNYHLAQERSFNNGRTLTESVAHNATLGNVERKNAEYEAAVARDGHRAPSAAAGPIPVPDRTHHQVAGETRLHPRYTNDELNAKDPDRRRGLIAAATRATNAQAAAAGAATPTRRAERPYERARREAREAAGTARPRRAAAAAPPVAPARAAAAATPATATPARADVQKIPHRNAAQRAEVVAHNIRGGMAPSEARALDSFFGTKSPKLDELKAGYAAKGYDSHLSVYASHGSISVSVRVTNPNASEEEKRNGHDQVTSSGNFSRTYQKDSSGKISVSHDIFVVSPRYRSGGVGKQLLSNSIRLNHELGMRHLHTGPAGSNSQKPYATWKTYKDNQKKAIDEHKAGTITAPEFRTRMATLSNNHNNSAMIGPHAWASMGFQWPRSEGDNIGARFKSYLVTHHGYTPANAQSVADEVKHHPRELLQVKTPDGKHAGDHFMSEFVGGAEGHWHIHMKDSDSGWQHMKTKLGLTDLRD